MVNDLDYTKVMHTLTGEHEFEITASYFLRVIADRISAPDFKNNLQQDLEDVVGQAVKIHELRPLSNSYFGNSKMLYAKVNVDSPGIFKKSFEVSDYADCSLDFARLHNDMMTVFIDGRGYQTITEHSKVTSMEDKEKVESVRDIFKQCIF